MQRKRGVKGIFFVIPFLMGLFVSFNSSSSVLAASLTLTTSGVQSIDVSSNGTGTSIDSDNIHITTDCRYGYIFALSTTVSDNNLYLNGDTTNNQTGTFFTPSDGITDLATADNTWGYYLPTNGGSLPTSTSVFNPVPIFGNPVTLKSSSQSASTTDISDDFSVYYGVSVSKNIASGTYKMMKDNNSVDGSLVYYALTAPQCSSYSISYNGNNADVGTSMSIKHNGVELGDQVNLYASNYKKTGYGFAGWSTEKLDPDSSTFDTDFSAAISNGLVFGPNETISFDSNLAGNKTDYNYNLTLYAVWVKSTGNLQGWNRCSKLSEGKVIALTDTRDNQAYAVAKLADGNCWMMENLRLGNTNSDNSSKARFFGGVFSGLANSETANFIITSTTANSLYSTDGTTAYTIDGDNPGNRFPRYNGDNTASTTPDMTAGDQNIYSYGNYYTFSAANATTKANEGNENTSLCPKGWMLPTGGQTTETYSWGALSAALGGPSDGSAVASTTAAEELSASFRSFPNNFIYSGRFADSSVGSKTTLGAYWSRTGTNTSGYYFYLADSDVRPATTGVNRGRGNVMRCIKTPEYYVHYDKNASDAVGAGSDGTTFYYLSSFDYDAEATSNHLTPANFKRDGYGFAGWSTEADVATHINETSHAYIYGQSEILFVSDHDAVSHADENYDINLYAVWIPSAGNMQNWNGCSNLSIGGITALTDTRDNETYAIAKLADGRCWMIENSRLNPSTANISSSNTNNPTTTFISEVAGTTSLTPSSWCNEYTVNCYNKISFNTDSITALTTHAEWETARYGNGVYYNWYTATAGNGTLSSGATSSTAQAAGDLCPKGWHIPTSGTGGELLTLINNLDRDYRNFPVALARSGIITDRIAYGSAAVFLTSSTAISSVVTYSLLNDSPMNDVYKSRGLPFRCINGATPSNN